MYPGFHLWRSVALAALLAGCAQSEPVQGPGARSASAAVSGPADIVRVRYQDRADLNRLAALHDALEQVDIEARTVTLLLSVSEQQQLAAAGYLLQVDRFATERLRAKALLASQPRPGFQRAGISGFPCYRTVEETADALFALQAARPELVEVLDIGDSWAKANPLPLNPYGSGYDIQVARITNRALPGPKPVFFLYAATHARELPTAELALRFAEKLVNGYGVDADATWLLDHIELHVLPQGNPDARKYAEQGNYWRKNVNAAHCPLPVTPATDGQVIGQGVDLNRNMAFQWGGGIAAEADSGSSMIDCMGSYRGTAGNSEPENQAVTDYMARVFPAQRGSAVTEPVNPDTPGVFISLHNAASLNIFPWGYTTETPAPDFGLMQTFNRKLSFFNGYLSCWDCLYASNGTHDDYSYAQHGVMSLTIELTDGDFFEGCESFEGSTAPTNLEALLYAAKATRLPYRLAAGPDSFDLSLTPARVAAGVPVVLGARADDGRYAGLSAAEQAAGDSEPVQAVAAMRYSIGRPSWAEGTAGISMAAVDGRFDSSSEAGQATLSTAGLKPGRHLVFVESQDSAGHWGVATALFLEVE